MPEVTTPTFEQAQAELEKILRELEDGTITLDDSLAKYERGISLLRHCSSHLNAVELKMKQLIGVSENGEPQLAPLAHEATVEKALRKPRKETS